MSSNRKEMKDVLRKLDTEIIFHENGEEWIENRGGHAVRLNFPLEEAEEYTPDMQDIFAGESSVLEKDTVPLPEITSHAYFLSGNLVIEIGAFYETKETDYEVL